MEEKLTEDEYKFARVREMIVDGKLDKAQEIIDTFDSQNAEARFLQGKLFMAKNWFSEARSCFKHAVKLEPDNAKYRQALDELEEFRKSDEYKQIKATQMGDKDGLVECCCLTACEGCGAGCCESICEGCS